MKNSAALSWQELEMELESMENEVKKPADTVKITLLIRKFGLEMEADVRPGDVQAWLQSCVSEEALQTMEFGRIEEVLEHGDITETVDDEMEWTLGESYVIRGQFYADMRSGPCSCRRAMESVAEEAEEDA